MYVHATYGLDWKALAWDNTYLGLIFLGVIQGV
jgi:hypothetical protein